jgi:NAD(P)-dependent dehydrogenase (short-subunit alcohol dehydrogenase family)
MKRLGQPVEIATACVMLADPQASYTSGKTISP